MKRRALAILLVAALMLSAGVLSVGSVAAADPPALVALWHFNGNANDSSGNGNDGTEYGGASYAAGKFDQALSLDGTGTYVEVHSDSVAVTDAITIEAWINPSAFSDYDAIVTNFAWATVNKQGSSFRVMANGKLMWRAVLSGNNTYFITSNATLSAGSWYHVAVTHDANYTRLYIDGVMDKEESPGGTIIDLGKDVKIGWDDWALDRVFSGLVDEVRIWDGALTADQVAASADGVSPTGSVVWLPPITNADFALQDGTTLPLKFQLFDNDVLLTTQQFVSVEVVGPAPFATKTYVLGDGADNLRWNDDEASYIANLKTKDGVWPAGEYTATVIVDGFAYGEVSFELSAVKGVGRGNSGK